MIKSKAFIQLSKMNKYSRQNGIRFYSDEIPNQPHPIRRTLGILKNDMLKIKNFFAPLFQKPDASSERKNAHTFRGVNSSKMDEFQTHCDILVIGGRGVGASIAYWMKMKARNGLNVVLVEKDEPLLDTKAHSTLPLGGLHQQFYMTENIQMSLYGAKFMMNAKEDLGVDIKFDPQGFLNLASEKNAEILKTMSQIQNELGARTELLSPERLRVKFPWLNTEDVALGCHGLENHGWFDSNNFLFGLRQKAKEYGTYFVKAEVTGFEFQDLSDVEIEGENAYSTYNALDRAIVKMPNGEIKTIKFAICIFATETNSENVARLANIGSGAGLLSIPLPIRRRNSYGCVFDLDSQTGPGLGTPCVVDFNGTNFRRNALTGSYITGFSTSSQDEGNTIQREEFENVILPNLMHRTKGINTPQITDSWESSYDYNIFDENGIVGPHPYYNNLYIATGFSALGLQQAPAVGRAISEMIIDGQFRTLDLSRLGFDRIIVDQPTREYAFM